MSRSQTGTRGQARTRGSRVAIQMLAPGIEKDAWFTRSPDATHLHLDRRCARKRCCSVDWNVSMDLRELEAIAERELVKHGLNNWVFGLAKTKRQQGVCKFRDRRIEIAEYYACHNPPEKVLDTLLHEIAHALAGPKARHGPVWKAMAKRLGAIPRACDTCKETVVMPGDWQATCDFCNKTYHKYKRPQRLNGYRCRCAARKTLLFHYVGDPARQPTIPLTVEQAAKWEAKCAGCSTVHLRIRKPKAGLWRCRCPHRCELVWRFRVFDDAG